MSGIVTLLLKNLAEVLSGSIGWDAGLQTCRQVQSKGWKPLKALNKEYKVIYLMYKLTKFMLALFDI